VSGGLGVAAPVTRCSLLLTGLLTTIELLRRSRVGFVSITENLDFTTPWSKLALVVLETLAEIYINKLRLETKKGRLAHAWDEMWNSSIPFGYCKGCCSNCTDPIGPGYYAMAVVAK
jgi:site-specific DNA recombinase